MATVALMLSAMLAGCLDSSGETLSVEVTYESTSATIVERWVDGELVEAMYPVLMFDFNRSATTGEFIQFSVIGEHAVGSTPASESTVVQVEFRKHGLQELTFAADVSGANPSELDEALPTATVRIEKRIEWSESATNDPMPMPIDTRNEAGVEPASALVIESTVFNPDLIANIGGGRDVEVFWEPHRQHTGRLSIATGYRQRGGISNVENLGLRHLGCARTSRELRGRTGRNRGRAGGLHSIRAP